MAQASMGRFLVLQLVLGLSYPLVAGAVEIRVDPQQPRVGQAVRIEIHEAREVKEGALILVHHLPGSRVVRISQLGPVPHQGSLQWRPEQAGLVRLEVRGANGETLGQRDLGVSFERVPPAALLILTLAGGLLFACVVLGLRFQLLQPPG